MSGITSDNPFRASGVVAAAAAGRTGTVDWITTPKVTGDSPVTGVTAKGYFLNTTAGAITINLPAGVAGSIVSMADYAGTWQTNNVTVSPNGSEKIGSIAADAPLKTEGQSVTFVYVDSTQGWVNIMDSTSNVIGITPFIHATGGTITCTGDYKIHTFTGPGTFCVSSLSPSAPENAADWMVVGGGGAAGGYYGGGGAGGFRESPGAASGCYTASPLAGGAAVTVSVQGYAVVVGGGGAAAPNCTSQGTVGDLSSALGTSSAGGGFGSGIPSGPAAGSGGSGGGEGYANAGGAGSGNTPPVSPPQGNNGGTGAPGGGGGGAGGGATAVGANAPGTNNAGAGGAGATTSISATPTAYAGGGGGSGASCGGAGGTGGGGTGQPSNGNTGGPSQRGGVNTGGGGGARGDSSPKLSGTGGSGAVVIRYKFQ